MLPRIGIRGVAASRDHVERPVAWSGADSAVFVIQSVAGRWATVRTRGVGTAILRATSEGKSEQATITVQ